MANPTSNYGWQMPTSTDLVTDLPTDFEVFGQAVDTALLGLKGGTTGRVLSKTSGTDMAFTWATDASGIPATIVDAKGDIIAATAADAVSRLAVGANDTILTADSTTATGLKWAAAAAGGMTELASGTLSGASVSIATISGLYKNLMLIIRNPYIAASTAFLRITINNSATATYGRWWTNSSGAVGGGGSSEAFWTIGNDASGSLVTGATNYGSASIEFPDYTSVTSQKGMNWQWTDRVNTWTAIGGTGGNGTNATVAITSIQIITSASTFSGGTYILYGVK